MDDNHHNLRQKLSTRKVNHFVSLLPNCLNFTLIRPQTAGHAGCFDGRHRSLSSAAQATHKRWHWGIWATNDSHHPAPKSRGPRFGWESEKCAWLKGIIAELAGGAVIISKFILCFLGREPANHCGKLFVCCVSLPHCQEAVLNTFQLCKMCRLSGWRESECQNGVSMHSVNASESLGLVSLLHNLSSRD